MARVSIYVPDELKARMDAAGDEVNWSEVARPAFHAAVAAFEHRKGQTMSTAIERLRASKTEYEPKASAAGQEDGRTWAANKAKYEDLLALHELNGFEDADEPAAALCEALSKDDEGPEDICEYCFGQKRWPSADYMRGFYLGAMFFFEDVRDNL